MLNSELLPAAGALNDANETVLNDTWTARKSAFASETVGFVARGAADLMRYWAGCNSSWCGGQTVSSIPACSRPRW